MPTPSDRRKNPGSIAENVQTSKKNRRARQKVRRFFDVYFVSGSFSSSVLAEAASPASPWISLGMIILVALPSEIVGSGGVQELQGLRQGRLHPVDGFCFSFGGHDTGSLFALGL